MLGFELVQTSSACPEQYDVFKEGQQVAYLRLRNGFFTCEVPDCGGKLVYEVQPEGDGIFEPHERERYLTEALQAVLAA